MSNEEMLKQLRNITKDKKNWKSRIDYVASKLDDDYSDEVKAKTLWILGEMGLNYPIEIEPYVKGIATYLDDENPKLRERAVNALGRIGRADKNLILNYFNQLMDMRNDDAGNVRLAFVWACENIATNSPELFCEKMDLFYNMIFDSNEKVRIESPEMFRVMGKRKPQCVEPYLKKLELIALNDTHRVVRIHSEGAVRITKKELK
ncbi:MAG: HEAT repeat domain-containing protein [Methanobrevibacter sp.]|uniref:sister chromatid cohesion protein PDS5 n=1 Tax=Methanobrevibacter sp. TaxID=66852 RepID=UPI001B27321F|nr:sister chromatid cohesion protein PDS5 [Methanobrevibacter sp.]MBO5151777.1 HEAT repeat domain-containing protein [Methanobrevibacter sp.]